MQLGSDLKNAFLLFLFSLWEYWLGKTKKLVANSSWELLFWVVGRLFKKGKTKMEQDVKVGNAGEAKVSESVASEKLEGSMKVGPVSVILVLELDNKALLELVASKLPGGMLHEAAVALQKALYPSA